MAGVEGRRGEGKEKVEGMTEGRGRKEGMGNRMGGIAPLLLGGTEATGQRCFIFGSLGLLCTPGVSSWSAHVHYVHGRPGGAG